MTKLGFPWINRTYLVSKNMTMSTALKRCQESQENLLLSRSWVSGAELQSGESLIWLRTPWKINMEPKNGGLEDDLPFQLGDFLVPAFNFPGCKCMTPSAFEANQPNPCFCSMSPQSWTHERRSRLVSMPDDELKHVNLTRVNGQLKREPFCWQLHFKLKT